MVLLTELESSLWGAVLKGKTDYEHKSERALHLSMASLDTSAKHEQYVPVMVQQGSNSFILCTLHAPGLLQQPLDLEINKGETVTFNLNGTGVVHLTGYYINEPDLDFGNNEGEEGEEEEANEAEAFANMMANAEHDFEEDDDDDDEDEDEDDDEDNDEDEEEEEETLVIKKRKINGTANGNSKKQKVEEVDEDDEDDEDEDEDDDVEELDDDEDEEEEDDEDDEEEEEPPKLLNSTEKPKPAKQNESQQKRNVNGVTIIDAQVGKGAEAKNGKQVHVYYTGRLQQNGKTFDSCLKGKPFKFRLGAGDVIKGWDIGVSGMRVGGKRVLTIPPHLAYGNKRVDIIPANSTLVFEVELKSVN